MDMHQRKKELEDAIEQSKNNHMMLLGRLEEIKYHLEQEDNVQDAEIIEKVEK